jgi:dTDP-4-amino-4,6-dideoxygalactose transaminase
MKIEKRASRKDVGTKKEFFYNSARQGMADLFGQMIMNNLLDVILLPSYIGYSPKEGSGIYDPISNLKNIETDFYKMSSELFIDFDDIVQKMGGYHKKMIAVLIVNYFGFVDPNYLKIINYIHSTNGWVITDNAHGFFTYQFQKHDYSDATFFSLHKMFPITYGGSLIINNTILRTFPFSGDDSLSIFLSKFDYKAISAIRRNNYLVLNKIIDLLDANDCFHPLRKGISEEEVPQTFPVVITKGNRNEIYILMNNAGFGVISLYHTLVDCLYKHEFEDSIWLSKNILNLPVHQDVDSGVYEEMIQYLLMCCIQTDKKN